MGILPTPKYEDEANPTQLELSLPFIKYFMKKKHRPKMSKMYFHPLVNKHALINEILGSIKFFFQKRILQSWMLFVIQFIVIKNWCLAYIQRF